MALQGNPAQAIQDGDCNLNIKKGRFLPFFVEIYSNNITKRYVAPSVVEVGVL